MKLSSIIDVINEGIVSASDIGIGYKFIRYGKKNNPVETVVDIYTTTNSKGKVVQVRYVTEQDYAGQKVRAELPIVTIQRSKPVK